MATPTSKDLREQLLDKIELAVRTKFFIDHNKNMQFLADDLMLLIESAMREAQLKALERITIGNKDELYVENVPIERYKEQLQSQTGTNQSKGSEL